MGGHYFVGSMRNLGDFSSQDCTLEHKDHCSALKRPHSSVQKSVGELEIQDTPQTHDSWPNSKLIVIHFCIIFHIHIMLYVNKNKLLLLFSLNLQVHH